VNPQITQIYTDIFLPQSHEVTKPFTLCLCAFVVKKLLSVPAHHHRRAAKRQ